MLSFGTGKQKQRLAILDDLWLPVLSVTGPRSGPVLVVSAGVHGDEYEGVRAIYEVFEELDPERLRGSLIAVPVVNPVAHRQWQRFNPTDGKNLARVFPGREDGSVSERLAARFGQEIIARGDFYLDLHSGGLRYAMPSMVGYEMADSRAASAAEIFGAPVTWGHPFIEPGRTISFARDHGIPSLYTEARGAGRIAPEDLRMMKRGIRNLMRHLGIEDLPIEAGPPPRRLFGAGNTDDGISSMETGFFLPEVGLLDVVTVGQRLGRLVDLLGNVLGEYRAIRTGTVGLVRELPVVEAGDTLFLLADESPPYAPGPCPPQG